MVSFKLRKTEGTGKRRERWEGTAGRLALGPSYASTWLASSTCLSYSPLAFGVALGGGFAWAGGWLPVNLYQLGGENVPIAWWNFCEQKCGFPVGAFLAWVLFFLPGCWLTGWGFWFWASSFGENTLAWKSKGLVWCLWGGQTTRLRSLNQTRKKDDNRGISAC